MLGRLISGIPSIKKILDIRVSEDMAVLRKKLAVI